MNNTISFIFTQSSSIFQLLKKKNDIFGMSFLKVHVGFKENAWYLYYAKHQEQFGEQHNIIKHLQELKKCLQIHKSVRKH